MSFEGRKVALVMEDEAWWLKSKCSSLSPEDADKLFFPSSGGKPQRSDSFCSNCPMLAICLNNAIVNKLSGFWAGTTDEQRKGMKAWLDNVVRLSMPPEPDPTERRRYLHVVESEDPRKWMDEEEPDDVVLMLLDHTEPTNAVAWKHAM